MLLLLSLINCVLADKEILTEKLQKIKTTLTKVCPLQNYTANNSTTKTTIKFSELKKIVKELKSYKKNKTEAPESLKKSWFETLNLNYDSNIQTLDLFFIFKALLRKNKALKKQDGEIDIPNKFKEICQDKDTTLSDKIKDSFKAKPQNIVVEDKKMTQVKY